MSILPRQCLALIATGVLLFLPACSRRDSESSLLRDGDRVIFLGDTLIEREQHHGWIELMLTTRFPTHNVTFRNLGWSADTPAGASRTGLSLVQATKQPPGEGWNQLVRQLKEAAPNVAFIGYGMASSLAEEASLPAFEKDYERLLDTLRTLSPDIRITLLGPLPHENIGPPWPNPEAHNERLRLFDQAIQMIATKHDLNFISFFNALPKLEGNPRLTSNGIHPTEAGYRTLAEVIEDHIFGDKGPWRVSPNVEPLRQTIIKKNTLFFHQSRPANQAYIFGFRNHEQGQNAAEISQFPALIAAEEEKISQLRQLMAVGDRASPVAEAAANAPPVSPQPLPSLIVADDLEVTLWAETPLLRNPIHMNFDAKGRLFVATSAIYPQIQPGQPATDQIIMLEDRHGTGRADHASVFADGLLIPTGVVPGDGGVYVAQSTELLHYRDSDGDGRADERTIVLSSFGTEDTHHNLHTLTWGPDGRMFLNQSNNTRTHVETPHGVIRHEAGGIFRFDPRDQQIGLMYRGWINAWGHAFDRFGQSFVTDGAGSSGVYWAIPGATYQTVAPSRRVLGSISPGNYPKFIGLETLHSRLFPADWQGDLITCDFRAHRIVRFKISDQGSGYITQEMSDLVRSTTSTFRPVDVKLGPDGALYVADWSNPIIQHGEVDFRDPRRDREHGRIWRIAVKDSVPLPRTDYTTHSTPDLLEALLAPEAYTRAKARRVLLERRDGSVLPALDAWVQQADAEGKLAALWLYAGLNHLPPALTEQLSKAEDPRIRAAAVRTLDAPDALDLLTQLVADPHPRVRLEAIRALGRLDSAEAATAALQALDHPMDPFLNYALWLTINELAEPWAQAVAADSTGTGIDEGHLEFALRALDPSTAGPLLHTLLARQSIPADGSGPWIELVGSGGLPNELRLLFDLLREGHFDDDAAVHVLEALADASRLRAVTPTGELSGLVPLLGEKPAPIRLAALKLARLWESREAADRIIEIAADHETQADQRTAAFDALLSIGGSTLRETLREMTTSSHALPVRQGAVLTLARVDPMEAIPAVLQLAHAMDAASQRADVKGLWRQVFSIRGAGAALSAALPEADLPPAMAQAALDAARETHADAMVVQALMKKAGVSLTTREFSPEEMRRFADTAVEKGDPYRGEQIYRRPELGCVACHAIGGVGGKLGPDLTSIGASAQPDYLLESLIYPEARIKEGYLALQIATKDQQVYSGTLVKETEREVEFRTLNGDLLSIPQSQIESRHEVGSLMPKGLIDGLLPEELADLVKFMAVLGRHPDFDASQGGVARHWRIYMVVSANQALGIERVVQGDATLADWKPVNALVSGDIPSDEIKRMLPERGGLRGLFAAVRFRPVRAGSVHVEFNGQYKAAWLNGQPLPEENPVILETKEGINELVFELIPTSLPSPLRLDSKDAVFIAP